MALLFPEGRGGGRKKSGSSFRARARVRARAGNAKRLGGSAGLKGRPECMLRAFIRSGDG
jgi:hypothetical protein